MGDGSEAGGAGGAAGFGAGFLTDFLAAFFAAGRAAFFATFFATFFAGAFFAAFLAGFLAAFLADFFAATFFFIAILCVPQGGFESPGKSIILQTRRIRSCFFLFCARLAIFTDQREVCMSGKAFAPPCSRPAEKRLLLTGCLTVAAQ